MKTENDTQRTRFEANYEKRQAVDTADAADEVADSMAVRTKLIAQMNSGEKTLAQIQAELAAIKRGARKAGKLTRSQVFNRA